MKKSLGNHILVEFMNCNSKIMNNVSTIQKIMVSPAQIARATVIKSTFHHFSKYGGFALPNFVKNKISIS